MSGTFWGELLEVTHHRGLNSSLRNAAVSSQISQPRQYLWKHTVLEDSMWKKKHLYKVLINKKTHPGSEKEARAPNCGCKTASDRRYSRTFWLRVRDQSCWWSLTVIADTTTLAAETNTWQGLSNDSKTTVASIHESWRLIRRVDWSGLVRICAQRLSRFLTREPDACRCSVFLFNKVHHLTLRLRLTACMCPNMGSLLVQFQLVDFTPKELCPVTTWTGDLWGRSKVPDSGMLAVIPLGLLWLMAGVCFVHSCIVFQNYY